MKQLIPIIAALVTLSAVLLSCNSKKRDAVYYEQMVDSIRKAEAVKEMYRKTTANGNPIEAYFDSLSRNSLPVSSVRDEWQRLGHFSNMPPTLCVRMGFPADSRIAAQSLPRLHQLQVLLLADQTDTTTVTLYLYTLDKQHEVVDHLCIYEEKDMDREEDFGQTFMDYYVTSNYTVTLLRYYRSRRHLEQEPELLDTRSYIINSEGFFEETIVEL